MKPETGKVSGFFNQIDMQRMYIRNKIVDGIMDENSHPFPELRKEFFCHFRDAFSI